MSDDAGREPTETPRGGFSYHVSDEQLRAFRSRTPGQRLAWREEMRELTARLASPRTKHWWRRLRTGR